MSFGTKLAAYRNRAGLTQEALANKTGIHRHHLSDIERDKLGSPNARTLALLSEALQLSPDEIIDLLEETKNQVDVG